MAVPQTKSYADYGTAGMAAMCNGFGGLPTRNFSAGQFEAVEAISGDALRDLLLRRGGESETTHACMAGCTIRCSNVFGGEDGKAIVSPLEYETIGLMGSNLGIADLDVIARLNWEANDLGLEYHRRGCSAGRGGRGGLDVVGRWRTGAGADGRNPSRHAARSGVGQRRSLGRAGAGRDARAGGQRAGHLRL